ncbi:M36 family metallopeptidase [Haliangium sp.]|uniref:M36 family metallopeptidase n=1 Tax=Haliangium sp. TaxID=2663208 RepID=UPI003D0F85FA
MVFRQRSGGVDIFRSELKVLMTRELELVSLTGNLHDMAGVPLALRRTALRRSAPDALALALRDLYGSATVASASVAIRELSGQGDGYQLLDLVATGPTSPTNIQLDMPARVKPVYFPMPNDLVLAHLVELLSSRGTDPRSQGYVYVVADDDGRVLYRQRRDMDSVYRYRVWADAAFPYAPADGPQEDYSPHPDGAPGDAAPAFVLPSALALEGLSVDPSRSPDPWLASDASETVGNNVDAYADHVEPDGFGDGDTRARVTGPNRFDQQYDPSSHPLSSSEQVHAAVVQLFYTTNWLHDYFYDAGFDEAAGNAQNDNYGRCSTCLGGDALLAEAQKRGPDPIIRSRANIFVPADGMPPRMEMYLWAVPDVSRSFTAADQSFATGIATFGPQSIPASTGPLVLANDGAGVPTDGCGELQDGLEGAIVLVDRGTCTFPVKVRNAEQRGAIAVVVANNRPGEPPRLDGTTPPIEVGIPALSISEEDGAFLKAQLAAGAVTAQIARQAGVERDGALDNTLVAHEWGHLLHLRLVECTTQQCAAQGEGWADFVALLMMLRDGDDLYGAYPIGSYANLALDGDSSYFGIRRAPYSRDPAKNALSFRHVSNGTPLPTHHPMQPSPATNSEAHNAGEVWASMLFDAYIGLLESGRHSFEEARQRMATYVVAGMVLAPADPTFTEQRDALLLAALARDPEDAALLAEGFARRGAGSCAVSPARHSESLDMVVEDTLVRPRMRVASVTLDDGILTCDGDGTLDAGESGILRAVVENPGMTTLTDTGVTVSIGSERISAATDPLNLEALGPFETTMLELPVVLGEEVSEIERVELGLSLINPQTCEQAIDQKVYVYIDHDLVPAATDTVESGRDVWQEVPLDLGPKDIWTTAPSAIDVRNRIWRGIDSSTMRNSALVSPPLVLRDDQPFRFSFTNRHEFDSEVNPDTGEFYGWDGAVIELSVDGGASWRDVSTYADAAYSGAISPLSLSPLAGRAGYVGRNASWPATDVVTLDFGTQLAGEEVRLRFRIATDDVVGAPGWEIDDLEATGLLNQPFWGLGADTSKCDPSNVRPQAVAGPDQTVASGVLVELNATASMDADGDALHFEWHQLGIPLVSLSEVGQARAEFIAPEVAQTTTLVFEVTVSDGIGADKDDVAILVLPPSDPGGGEPPLRIGGGGCAAGGTTPLPWYTVVILLGFAVLGRGAVTGRGLRRVLCKLRSLVGRR